MPLDPDPRPSLGTPWQELCDGLNQLGYPDAENLATRLLEFGSYLLEENGKTNLVGTQQIEGLIGAHFLDSLAPIGTRHLDSPLVDVGSGAGFPAIPLAMACKGLSIIMLEPREKRAAFLANAIERFGLRNAAVLKLTAETAGRKSWRNRASSATARAVRNPSTTLELALPLLRRGGTLLMYAGRQVAPTSQQLEVAALLGGSLKEASAVQVPYLTAVRHAWWFEKTGKTPDDYPRRSKMPSRQPL